MNRTFTQSKQTGGLFSRALLLLALVLGVQLGANAQVTTQAPYCNADHNYMNGGGSCYNSYGFAILSVKVGSIDKKNIPCTSSNTIGAGPYRFWNNGPFTNLSGGAKYDITVGSPSGSYTTQQAAWIDYNQDNQFSANENIALFGVLSANSTVTKTFTVPCTAKPGKTRLRVRADYYYSGGPQWQTSQGCNSSAYGYGETMDFEVTIVAGQNPSANFYLPDTIFTKSPATFINFNQAGYISHAWSTSVGGLTTTVGTGTNFNFSFPSAGSYQVRLTSTNCQGSATTTKNVTVVDPTVAPTVRFLASRNNIELDPSDLVVDEIVDFKDFSTSGPTDYTWEITPDQFTKFWFDVTSTPGYIPGTLAGPNAKSISIFFTDTAKYEVCLTASNLVGSTKLCKPNYVNIFYPTNKASYKNNMCSSLNSSLDSGVIYDPGGPTANYSAAVYFCTFNINACEAQEIEMWFDQDIFELYYYGSVTIYDGKDNSGDKLFEIGKNPITINSAAPTKHFFAKSGYAYVEFVNQYNFYSGKGFGLFWKSKRVNDGPLKTNFNVLNTRNDSIYECAAGTKVWFEDKTAGSRVITDRQWIFDFDPNISYPPGYEDFPDNGNEKAPLYTYSAAKTYTVRLVAGSCENYDTTYRTFTIGTTSMLPNVDFGADETILPKGGQTILRNKTVAWCSGSWTITPGTYTLLNGSTLNDPNPSVRFDATGRYTIKYTANNDNGSASRTRTDFIRVIEYCSPSVGTSYQSMSISRVKIDNMENKSTSDPSGYQDFTNLPATDLYIGTSYNLEVERDQTFDAADRRVWIDFNRDGDFDATEIVLSDNNATTKLLKNTITIPDVSSVTPGMARMRVGVALAGKPFNPCGLIDAGEFEDYNVNLKLDDKAPIINLLGKDTVYVEVNTTYTDAGATALDNREGDITSKIVTNNQVDIKQTGIYVVTYNVKDGSGLPAPQRVRFVFVLADMTKPVITVTGATNTIHEAGTPYTDLGATALDNPGANNVTNLIITSNNVNVNKLGVYTVDYTVTDAYGNKDSKTRSVEVKDTKAPVVKDDIGGNPMTVQVGTRFVDPTYALDLFEGKLPVMVVTGSVYTDAAGIANTFGKYKVTYTAMDGSGNKATNLTREYVVTDLIPPVLSSRSASDFMVVNVHDLKFVEPAVTGTDNYFKTVTITRDAGGFDIHKLGTYYITYTGTDGAGNTTTWVRTITVADLEKPEVVAHSLNLQRWTTFNPMTGVSVVDNYYAPVNFLPPFANNCRVEVISHNVDMAAVGVYTVIYQAVDGSGNLSPLYTRTVNVTENTTGIADVAENSMNIYPNPSTGKFDIEFGAPVGENTTVTITNVAGQAVKAIGGNQIVNGKLTVDLSGVAAGVYVVKVEGQGFNAAKKVTITY